MKYAVVFGRAGFMAASLPSPEVEPGLVEGAAPPVAERGLWISEEFSVTLLHLGKRFKVRSTKPLPQEEQLKKCKLLKLWVGRLRFAIGKASI